MTERNDSRELNDFNGQYQVLLGNYQLTAENLAAEVVQKMRDETERLINKWQELPVGSGLVFNFRP